MDIAFEGKLEKLLVLLYGLKKDETSEKHKKGDTWPQTFVMKRLKDLCWFLIKKEDIIKWQIFKVLAENPLNRSVLQKYLMLRVVEWMTAGGDWHRTFTEVQERPKLVSKLMMEQ